MIALEMSTRRRARSARGQKRRAASAGGDAALRAAGLQRASAHAAATKRLRRAARDPFVDLSRRESQRIRIGSRAETHSPLPEYVQHMPQLASASRPNEGHGSLGRSARGRGVGAAAGTPLGEDSTESCPVSN